MTQPPLVRPVGTTTEVLQTWGRTHNHAGPKPPTYRLVQHCTVAVERWCRHCGNYRPADEIDPRRGRCRACRSVIDAAERDDIRNRWRAQNVRARRYNVPLECSLADWVQLINDAGQRCTQPGCNAPYGAVVHRIPMAHGGAHRPDNLQVMCTPCQRAKSARDLNHHHGEPCMRPSTARAPVS